MSRSLLKYYVLPVFSLGLLLSACSPKSGGSGAGSPVATEWKEGYGGDSIALEAVHIIEQACFSAKRLRPTLLKSALETKVEVAESICGLLKPGALVIESVKQPKVNGLDKDAANYPSAQPRRLEVKASYWSGLTTTVQARDKLIFHELLPLIGIDDTDYVRSTRLMIAIETSRGTAPDVVCDARRIDAVMSGANADIARFVGRELGLMRCESAIEILSSFKPDKPEDDSIADEVAQALAFGAFIGAAQAPDQPSSTQFEDFFVRTATALPAVFGSWSAGLCAQDSPQKGPNSNLCGGLLTFMFGATPEQKELIVAKDRGAIDFDRATMNFLNRLAETPKLMNAFVDKGRVDPDLAKAAIRSQNWSPLFFLGQVHRALKMPGRASTEILQGLPWSEVLQDGAEILSGPGNPTRRMDFRKCSIPDLRLHSEGLLDGEMPQLHCDSAAAT